MVSPGDRISLELSELQEITLLQEHLTIAAVEANQGARVGIVDVANAVSGFGRRIGELER